MVCFVSKMLKDQGYDDVTLKTKPCEELHEETNFWSGLKMLGTMGKEKLILTLKPLLFRKHNFLNFLKHLLRKKQIYFCFRKSIC